jgi:hypothetical protein
LRGETDISRIPWQNAKNAHLSLDNAALLQTEARAADALINAASSDHRGAVEALIAAMFKRTFHHYNEATQLP